MKEMNEMKKIGAEKLTNEELDQVNGGYAGVDDFIVWFSKKAGRRIRRLFKH